MKKWIMCIWIMALCLCLISCSSSVDVEDSNRVTLTYNNGGKRIQRSLNQDESSQIVEILHNKRYFEASWDIDTCDFDKNVSLTVGNTVFAVAKDRCAMLKDLSNGELILLTDAEHSIIVALFDTYGGVLPCREEAEG